LPKLRRSIVDPDFERTPGFERADLTLRDGSKLSGLVKDRTNYRLQLQLKDGALRSVPVETIETVELTKPSIMPADYKTKLTRDDVTNLVSYLRQQGAN
jgi:putative heme-binding domain-containing protein